MYEKGRGVDKDEERSMYWLQRAIDQGEPDGRQTLLDMKQMRNDNRFLDCCKPM